MAYGVANEHVLFYFQETTFATAPADWSASGIAFQCVEPDTSGLVQQSLDNNNIRARSLATRQKVRGLKSESTFPFGCYHHGRGGALVAEGANASTFFLADFLRNAMGGRQLGRRSGIAGGTAAIPNVDAGQGTGWTPGAVGFACDTSDSSRGFFVVVESVSTDAITLQYSLPFTPDATADTLGAVVANYFDTDALKDRADSNYITHAFFDSGDLADDNVQMLGCKLNIAGIDGTNAGEEPLIRFEALVTRWTKDGLSAPTPGAAPVGDAPLVTSTGANTFFRAANAGSPPTTMTTYDASNVKITVGVASAMRKGVGGTEGVFGFHLSSMDEVMIEADFDFDDQWVTDYEAGTRKKILIQIGTTAGTAIGYYAPNCEIVETPVRGDEDNVAVSRVKFRCLENDGTTTATGDNLEQYRSKLQILHSVPIV